MAVTATKGVQVDVSELTAHLHDFSKVLGVKLGEVVREQSGLFCMDLVRYTRPFNSPGKGLDSDAKKKGMENVQKAIFKVFQPIAHATKEQVSAIGRYDVFKMWTKVNGEQTIGNSRKMRWESFQKKYPGRSSVKFIEGGDMSAMEKLHKSLRRYQGKGGLQPYVKNAKSAFAIVPKEKDIERYIKKKWADVGSMKSGYWFASQKIRARDVTAPAWIKHAEGAQYAIGIPETYKPMMPTVTVGNTVGARAMPSGLLKSAISYRMYAMRAKMAAELNKQKTSIWAATSKGQTTNTAKYF